MLAKWKSDITNKCGSALMFPLASTVGKKMLNWYQNDVNSWCMSTHHQQQVKNEGFCDVNCRHQIDINYWYQIDIRKKCFNQNVFSTKMFFSPNSVANGHFLGIFLISYWLYVLMSVYLQFDISTMWKRVYWCCAMILINFSTHMGWKSLEMALGFKG